MELLALLSKNEKMILEVKAALKKYTVYPLKTLDELEDLNSNIPLNLVLMDTDCLGLTELREFLDRFDDGMAVIITRDDIRRDILNLPNSVISSISAGATGDSFLMSVEEALEKQKLRRRLKLLKQSGRSTPPSYDQGFGIQKPDRSGDVSEPLTTGRVIHEKIIVNFARMLTASFDMRKLLDTFMDSVMEIARVSRMSVLLRNKQGFYVKTHYGLDPYIADNMRISRDSALVSWLAKTGRIIHKPANFVDSSDVDVSSDMEALQCTVSFPMIYKGKLIGIFNIDSKVTEEPFHKEELEIIYVLCNYLAAAVKDIDVYHQMWYQKEFTKNILLSMNSGMIAIDRDETITFFNKQASEILAIDAENMIGKNIRALPYPLGDILLRTMVAGTSYSRHEVEMTTGELTLGINSYRLQDEHHIPTGAGIIFSDISDSKKLSEQNNRTAKLEAVNNLVAKIAHEVRNPLTSIQTYIQLLSDKLTDDDLHNFYLSTVRDSINKLTGLIDKLVSFSSSENYNMKHYDVNVFINESFEFLLRNLPVSHRLSKILSDTHLTINIDKRQMLKAIYYIISNIIDMTPEGTLIRIGTYGTKPEEPFLEISIEFTQTGTTVKDKKALLKPLLDIEHLGTELNIPISHKIIEAHEGSLDIRSFDKLHSFIIKLPLVERRDAQVSSEEGWVRGQ
jgi:nitrogen-specific signal transduction histidine kinase